MKRPTLILAAAVPVLLAGCVTVPSGPSVMALPGSGKTFEQFRADDVDCRQYAQYQTGGADANQAAVDSGVRSAAIGTVVGAVAGAAMGGHDGAGSGAGAGLLMGSMVGTGAAQSSANATQRNYDHAYIQCMYAKGEQVPVSGVTSRQIQAPASTTGTAPPAGNLPPPPPPGYAPPPR